MNSLGTATTSAAAQGLASAAAGSVVPAAAGAPSALRGHLHLVAAAVGGRQTRVAHQSFCAPFHLGKPYWDGHVLQVQVVNSTAGILAGDELELDVAVGPGGSLSVTTPAAARAFMMRSGAALCRQRFAVAAGAWLEYLPEPLYPHRDTNYAQATRLELAAGASAFFVDQLAPGRVGLGECWAWHRLSLGLEVHLDSRLLLREQLDASGPELGQLAGFYQMPEAWFANALVAAPGLAGDHPVLASIRALHRDGCLCGATALAPGVWMVRLVAATGLVLRDALAELRGMLAPVLPGLQADHRKL